MSGDATRLLVELLQVAGHPLPVLALRDLPTIGDDLPKVLAAAEADGLVIVADDGWVTIAPAGAEHTAPRGAVRTAELHATLGRLLHGRSAVAPAVVARHRLAGLIADPDPEVVPDALTVATAALRTGDLTDAIDLFSAALNALDHGAEPATARVEALGGLAEALAWAGRRSDSEALRREAALEALRSGDPARLAAAALVWAGQSVSVDDDPTNTALVDRALDAIGEAAAGDPQLARLTAQLLGLRADRTVFADLPRARAIADDALERARATGDPDTVIRNAFTKRICIWHPTTQEASLALAAEMVALAPLSVDHPEYGAVARLQVFLELGDFAHFDAELRSLERRVSAQRGRFERVWTDTLVAARALVTGDWAEVDERVASAQAFTAGFDYDILEQLLLAQQMLAAWHQGADLTSLVTDDALPAGPMRQAWAACLLGLTADQLSPDVVEAGLVTHLGDGLGGVRDDLTWGNVIACLSMAAAEARSTVHARMLADAIEPIADQWAATGGAVCFGPFAWHLGRLYGVLGRTDDSLAALDRALAACIAASADPWTARVHLAIATVDPAAATGHAVEARAIAERLGMPAVAATASRLLGRGSRSTLPAGLTEREIEVLRLVAEGLTNKDIAASLHLSVKTVERHLLNSYTKIGARNRSEATAFVIRNHLARPPA
jgi:DNA-binding CsgD family transcriptional regulator